MPSISTECNIDKIVFNADISGVDSIRDFLFNVAIRANVLKAFGKMLKMDLNNSSTSSNKPTRFFACES